MTYNISFDIAAILLLIVLAVGMKTVLYTDTPGHKLVRRYMYSVIACAVIDVITAYTICYGTMVPDPVNLILNSLYQYSSIFCVAVAMRTILNYFPSASKTSVIINRILLYIQAMFITLNIIITGAEFIQSLGELIRAYLAEKTDPAQVHAKYRYLQSRRRGDRP